MPCFSLTSTPGRRRAALAGAGTLLTLAAGCGDSAEPSAAPSPQAPTAPVDRLRQSAANAAQAAHTFAATFPDGRVSGVTDPGRRGRLVEPAGAGAATVFSRDSDLFVRVPAGRPAQWYKVDPAKLPERNRAAGMVGAGDPASVEALLTGVTEASEQAGTYTAVLDMAKLPAADQPADPAHVAALGAAATRIPVTATADQANRMTAFTMNIPAAGRFRAGTVDFRYTYRDVSLPDVSSAQPATTAVYTFLTS
ncbi:MAG TPA: hypothetical protein VFY17_02905 [Pilimelia sp.]|nr:hypothetical protein [Pilimelia sp.]